MEEKLKDLKAQAYDCLRQIENWNNQLKNINQSIIQTEQSIAPKPTEQKDQNG